MRFSFPAFAFLLTLPCLAAQPKISIPAADIQLLKTTDYVEVTGTNQHGQREDFNIHNARAIKQFIDLITDARYVAVPKSLKPDFKSPSAYDVHFFSHGQSIFEMKIIAETILDIPNDASYYMESDRYSDLLMAPLRRLR